MSTERRTSVENVYYGVLTPQIRAVKVFSIVTSLSGILAQPIILAQAESVGSVPAIVGLCTFVGFFTFVTPFLLHSITKKYVTHLDYDAGCDEYVATVVTFFLKQKKIRFKVDDVVVPDLPGMFTSMVIKGTPLFVDPSLFPDPTHYGRIMGYDKPIDFKLKSAGPKDVS